MPNASATVAEWLLDEGRSHLEQMTDSQPIAEIKRAIAEHAAAVPWPTARQQVEQKIEEALKVDVGSLLIAAWLRPALLVKYLDSSRYPAGETILAHLGEHTVEIALKPSIGVYVGQLLVKEIPVKASLSLTLKGFILTIKGGQVLQMTTGTCQAKGQVAVAGVTVAEKKSRSVELPGVIRFGGEGRRIEGTAT